MISGLYAAIFSCIILFVLIQPSDEAVRFTKHPDSTFYVLKGQTAKFTWDYHADNINLELDSESPRWYFHNNSNYMIGYGDAFDGRKFKIHPTCPARLRTPTVRVSLEGKATLVITNVTLADSGTYICRLFLSSGSLSSMPTSKVQLFVTVSEFTNVPANKLYVVKGETAKFTWDYQVFDMGRNFDSQSPRWYFHDVSSLIGYGDAYDGRRFKISRKTCPPRFLTPRVRVIVEGKATLVIKNVTLADSGTYGCILFLLTGSVNSMPTSQVQLIVTENPSFTLKPNHKAIAIESSDLNFNCATVGIPTPNVTWVQVITGVTISKGLGTAVLLLPKIKRMQSGDYECRAANNPNEAPIIAKTMVTVYYKPTVEKASSTAKTSSWAGNTMYLRCYWSSSLPIPSWTWYNSNSDRITNVRSITNGSEVTVLTGNNSHDYGMYTCKATNIAGSDWHNISVTRLFPPGTTPLIEVAALRSSSVTIIWAMPVDSGGSPVTRYKLLIDSKAFYINSSKILVYQEITGLQENTEYKVTVLAGNIAGYGDASIKLFNTTKQEPKSKSCPASSQRNSGFDAKIGILAAFFALSLITIVMLLVFIVWKHRRTNSQNTIKQEQKNEEVYENPDAIGMGPLTSTSRYPSQSKEKPKPDKTPVNTDSWNTDQENYQQLNSASLQNSTTSSSAYEPLRKGHPTKQTLQSRTIGYQNPQTYSNVTSA